MQFALISVMPAGIMAWEYHPNTIGFGKVIIFLPPNEKSVTTLWEAVDKFKKTHCILVQDLTFNCGIFKVVEKQKPYSRHLEQVLSVSAMQHPQALPEAFNSMRK